MSPPPQRVADREPGRLGTQLLVERRRRPSPANTPGTHEWRSVKPQTVNDMQRRTAQAALQHATEVLGLAGQRRGRRPGRHAHVGLGDGDVQPERGEASQVLRQAREAVLDAEVALEADAVDRHALAAQALTSAYTASLLGPSPSML